MTHFEDYLGGVMSHAPEITEATAKHSGDLSSNGLITLSYEATKVLRSTLKAVLPEQFRELLTTRTVPPSSPNRSRPAP